MGDGAGIEQRERDEYRRLSCAARLNRIMGGSADGNGTVRAFFCERGFCWAHEMKTLDIGAAYCQHIVVVLVVSGVWKRSGDKIGREAVAAVKLCGASQPNNGRKRGRQRYGSRFFL